MAKQMKLDKHAFTLIELLIVITIIAIIAAVIFVALNPLARFSSARDTIRVSQVTQIKKALDLYLMDNGNYPSSTQWSSGSIISPSGIAYLGSIPVAPTPPDGSCNSSTNAYVYTPSTTTISYSLSFCLGSSVDTISAGNKVLTPAGISSATSGPTFSCGTDQVTIASIAGHACNTGAPDYDTCAYDTVQIGAQCWMKQNINIGAYVTGVTTQTNSSTLQKYCYGDTTGNCPTYGGLYQWGEAMQYSVTELAQGVCPDGWHIPSDAEQNTLDQYLNDTTCNANRSNLWDCANAGTKLMTGGSSHFESLLAGRRATNGTFGGLGISAFYWSSSVTSTSAWVRYLNVNPTVDRYANTQASGFSVRCLKN